jgi:putative flippase GtrA
MVERVYQLARFCVVGVACFALGLALLAGLHEVAGLHYLVAFMLSFVTTSTVGYLLNGRFTFAIRNTGWRGVGRYSLINAVSLLLNSLALKLLVDAAHLWYLGASMILALINAPITFTAHRLISYRMGRKRASADRALVP